MIKITLKGLPKTTNSNSRQTWRAQRAESRKWKNLVSKYVYIHLLKPEKPFAKAKVTITRYSSNEPDFDGLVSAGKHLIDGLIEAGILENDRMSNIGRPEYLWERAPRNQGHVTIEVEEVSE